MPCIERWIFYLFFICFSLKRVPAPAPSPRNYATGGAEKAQVQAGTAKTNTFLASRVGSVGRLALITHQDSTRLNR